MVKLMTFKPSCPIPAAGLCFHPIVKIYDEFCGVAYAMVSYSAIIYCIYCSRFVLYSYCKDTSI